MKDKRFHGYRIVAACFVIQGVIIGAMFAYGVFFRELENEFGWSRATISGASSLAFVTMGVLAVVAGKLNDRIGPRALITVSAVLFGVGYAMLSSVQAPWQLFLFYGVLAGVGFSAHDVVTLSTVTRWFVRRRGAMTGITKAGTGVGQLLVPVIAATLIAAYGWRSAVFIIGTASLVILLVVAQFLRRDPRSVGQYPDGVETQIGRPPVGSREAGMTLAEAAVTRQFWILCAIQMAVFFSLLTVMIHIVPHATDLGVAPRVAAMILSTIGAVSIAGRLTIGTLFDRLGGRRSLTICFAVLLTSFVVLQLAETTWMLFLFAIIYGFAHGGFFTVMSPTLAEFFGIGSHGVIFGMVLFSGTIGGAIGPLLAGILFDKTGSYVVVFLILTGFGLLGLLLTSALRPMKSQATISDREPVK
ncbi:MAG: OFA family MFS transporter [Gammaproteobacteria bacterium]|nr:MAG: OFA family MFS transporter [Gammaproteobacteria bacterium]